MNCSDIEPRLSAYLDKELKADEHAQVETHLLSCESCQKQRQQLQAASKVFANWDEPKLTVPTLTIPAPSERHPATLISIIATVAAVLLGGVLWFGNSQGWFSKVTDSQNPVLVTAKDSYYILKTQPATQSVVVQGFDSFDVSQYQNGDSLQGHELIRVEQDALTFQSLQGDDRRLVEKMNEKAKHKLSQEVVQLRLHHQGNGMSDNDLERLKDIAYFGLAPEGIQLLEEIATSSSSHANRAKSFLDFNREEKRLSLLANAVRVGDVRFRLRAVHGLGKAASPRGLDYLKTLAIELKDDIGLACVDALQDYGGHRALGMMYQVAEQSQSPIIAKRARLAASEITEALSDEK